MPIFALRLT